MIGLEFSLGDAAPADAAALTELYLWSRTAAMPWLHSPHDHAATSWWMQQIVLAEQRVRIACADSRLLGFSAVAGSWLEQLYVAPDAQGRGVGTALLEDAKCARPDGLSLHVFTRNRRARRFYQASGFRLVAQSDGQRNAEREPDCTCVWASVHQ